MYSFSRLIDTYVLPELVHFVLISISFCISFIIQRVLPYVHKLCHSLGILMISTSLELLDRLWLSRRGLDRQSQIVIDNDLLMITG